MNFKHLLFGFDGRINRAKVWLGLLILAVGYMIVTFVLAFVGAIIAAAAGLPAISFVLVGIMVCVSLWSTFALYIKRLHDRNKSGWWLLVFMFLPMIPGAIQFSMMFSTMTSMMTNPGAVPETSTLMMVSGLVAFALALWGFVEIFCLRGTEGPNAYGPDPLPSQS